MNIRQVKTIPFDLEISDVAFVDAENICVVTPQADIWLISILPIENKPKLICSGKHILAPLSESLEMPDLEPAGGSYPLICVSHSGRKALVNTHDCVIVAVDLDNPATADLILSIWGLYYPSVQFSSDDSWLAVCRDETFICNLQQKQWLRFDSFDVVGWFPGKAELLCLDSIEKQVARLTPVSHPECSASAKVLGLIHSLHEFTGDVPVFLSKTQAICFVVPLDDHSLAWWQVEPFVLIDQVNFHDFGLSGTIEEIQAFNDGRHFSITTESGLQLWDALERKPAVDFIVPTTTRIVFSAMEARFMTIESSQPPNYDPAKAAVRPEKVLTLWEI